MTTAYNSGGAVLTDKNTLKIGLKPYTVEHRGEAQRISDALMRDCLNQRYRELSHDQLRRFLESAFCLIDEHNLVNLLPGVQMLDDERVLMIYRPSYCVISAGIYARTHIPMAREPITSHLKRLMDAAFQYDIVVPGIGSEEAKCVILRMLFFAGARRLLETEPHFSDHFSKFMGQTIEKLEKTATPDNPNGTWNIDGCTQLPCNARMHQLLAIWRNQTISVFVYGSLMRGHRANRLIASGSFAGRFLLDGYEMYSLGSFPGLWPGNGKVIGEVWFVDEDTLDLLDDYESEGYLYCRKRVTVSSPVGEVDAEVYVCMSRPEGHPIGSEWLTNGDDSH